MPTMEATASTFISARPTPSSLPRPSLRRSRVQVVGGVRRRPLAAAASTSNYVVPLDAAPSGITRPLVEILRDLNKRVPDTIVLPASRRASASDPVVPWYHANRMLSFYAPGWCGEVRDVIYADNGKVTVVYRVTIRGTDGEDEAAVFLLFGTCRRWMTKPLLQFLRFNGEDPQRLSSVVLLQYLQLNSSIPLVQTPDSLPEEPPGGHQLVCSTLEALGDWRCSIFESELSSDKRWLVGSIYNL